jgi:dihydroorotate dehydrogenase electron transfer subunit
MTGLKLDNMKDVILTVKSNSKIADSVYKMELEGDISAVTAPGQFVNIMLEGLYLRRPISVNDVCGNVLTIIYKVVGKGTEKMSIMEPGQKLDVLTGLGNGYDTETAGDHPLLVGGGVGVPPLYCLAKNLIRQGRRVSVILGFNSAGDVFYEDEFRALGCDVTVATADGSCGEKGFVTDVLPEGCDSDPGYSHVYACGPEPMLKALGKAIRTPGQFSFEERMGCGFGACMGCSCKTVTGNKRICKEGPVMRTEDIIW